MGGSESTPPPPSSMCHCVCRIIRKLKELAASFIRAYDSNKDRMTQIVKEFKEIADDVKETVRNANKLENEKKSINKVEKLAKEFMEMVEPLKNDLEEIKRMCEKLEQISAGDQAGNTLITQVSKVGRKSGVVLSSTEFLMTFMNCLLSLIEKYFRGSATPQEKEKLRNSIIQSADRCQEVVDNFDEMKKELKDFSEM